ncbi:putative ribonuclease H protein [Citrus sinensis]|uniref:Ribonuclease H protein n=1 Tax=Citrus sinensis TaxID=2711 RepID=A0ACB8N6T2_CITSI|nr:putative ribonuclease H protein [Citrus sinensis]
MISWRDICKPKSAGGLGFKSLAIMNCALHMKIAWGLISSPNSLWVQVIVCKYGVDIRNPPLMLPTRYGSHLWKSIGNVWSDVLASRRWCLGDGQSVWFWWDLWVTRDVPLAAYTTNNLPSNILDGKVADFVKEDGSWYWERFEQFLPANIIIQIAAFHPPSPDKGTDSLLWCTVWSWKGPQSVRIFLWQALHDRLKTKAELVRRHIPVSTSCDLCGAVTEDAMHVLRDYALVKRFWILILPENKRQQFFNWRLHDWLRTNLGIVGGLGSVSNWAIFFGIALWRLWFWRNQFIFNQVSMDPNVVLMDVFTRTISWKPPDWPWCALNCDGAHNREGISTAGGLIRDHFGRWLSGFGMMIGSYSVTVAELWGLYQGLQLAWNSGIRKIKPTLEINHYAPLIRTIKDYLKMDWQVSISHIYREANFAADYMASLAFSIPLGLTIYHTPPLGISPFLFKNAYGVAHSRLGVL